ncbi:hypothetical protein GUJ93_ZPchr0001g31087 [Zizania palustris]|uniref:lipid-A-disaccharide synthase n=1 Tax=Zizania palustris TaxID=103762 RepID=A0A8J5VPQ0_ZIZPA|nr:hypothetical protein GUJ93_ZPchr0001g31087 [Zizania palustris]
MSKYNSVFFCCLGRYSQVVRPLHVHYVAPSFWAWKDGESRLAKLHNFVDHLLCILPFEEEICKLNGLPATYVGHPLLDDAICLNMEKESSSNNSMHQRSGEAFRVEHAISPDSTIITILPGSRVQEVARMLPIFLQTMKHLSRTFGELSLVIPVAPHRDLRAYVENVVQSGPFPVVLIPGVSLKERYDAFNASRAALCTSGTAVMELMLAKLPCVVAYQAHFITESENLAAKLREVIVNDDVRQLQVESAAQLLEVLYEPMKQRGGLFQEELHNSSLLSNIYSPGTIAALTVLYMDKHQQTSFRHILLAALGPQLEKQNEFWFLNCCRDQIRSWLEFPGGNLEAGGRPEPGGTVGSLEVRTSILHEAFVAVNLASA